MEETPLIEEKRERGGFGGGLHMEALLHVSVSMIDRHVGRATNL